MKVKVDVEGSDKIAALKAEIADLTKEILADKAALQTHGASFAEASARVAPLTGRLRDATRELKTLEPAAKAGRTGLLQLSYAVDDLQYGFRAIVNNIPQIALGLGAGAGVAGAAQIAAVAISTLVNHWTELAAMAQSAWEGGSAERLKVLAERAETAAAAFEKLAKAPTEFEAKATTIRNKALENAPVETIRKALTDTMLKEGQGAEKRIAGTQTLAGYGPDSDVMKRIREKQQKRLDQEQYDKTAKMAAELIGQMEQGGEPGKVAKAFIDHMIKVNPKAFPEDFKEAMKEGDPAAVKAKADAEKAAKAAAAERKGDEEMRDRQKKDAETARKAVTERLQTERTQRIQALEDEREALTKTRKKEQESMRDVSHPSISSSGQEMVSKLQQAALDLYPKQQLDKLKSIDGRLEKIHDAIKNERRKATFG